VIGIYGFHLDSSPTFAGLVVENGPVNDPWWYKLASMYFSPPLSVISESPYFDRFCDDAEETESTITSATSVSEDEGAECNKTCATDTCSSEVAEVSMILALLRAHFYSISLSSLPNSCLSSRTSTFSHLFGCCWSFLPRKLSLEAMNCCLLIIPTAIMAISRQRGKKVSHCPDDLNYPF